MKPRLNSGSDIICTSPPSSGTCATTNAASRNSMNSVVKARGRRPNRRNASPTQRGPRDAGTVFSSSGMSARVPRVGDAVAQHTLEMSGILGAQQRGHARQVPVPQPADPEAQGGCPQQSGQGPLFVAGQRPGALVGGDKSGRQGLVQCAAVV